MKRLETKEYPNVIPFFQRSSAAPTFVYSVLQQVIEGEVYVNQPDSPSAIFLGTKSGIYHLAGDASNQEVIRWLNNYYKQQIKGKAERFTLFSSSGGWDEVIHRLFGEDLRQVKRFAYRFNPDLFPLERSQPYPDEFKLHEIEERTIQMSEEFGIGYYEKYWGGVHNFLHNGFGFCLEQDGLLVSECTAIFANPYAAEIDIVTDEHYRGKGLGFIVAHAFIRRCLQMGITPHWDCNIDNFASCRMAERLGFEQPIPYTIFALK